jgi:integrase
VWQLKKDGLSDTTIRNYSNSLKRLVESGAELSDPESIKAVLAFREEWKNSTKLLMVASYQKYAVLNGIRWNPPKYEVNRKLPFIPLEREIDELIACCGKKMSVILQLLKETGMRIGEALRLEWIDMDFEKRILILNNPEKHGNPRAFKMSEKLMSMFNRLPRDSSKVFATSWCTSINNFSAQRKNAAKKLGNPKATEDSFSYAETLEATMEYHRTKDILYVMKLLGHKNIANTLIYTQLVEFEGDEYCSAVASGLEEAKKLIEAGFEYVCNHDGLMLFRKRK